MTDSRSRRPRRSGVARMAVAFAAVAIAAAPAGAMAAPGYSTSSPALVALNAGVAGSVVPLINSGEAVFGDTFEGIPDGIGVAPAPGKARYVDVYVAHEQSHVPFGPTPATVFADYQDSSVSRVRLDVASKKITDLEVVFPASAGLIRFCSAFMAGPDEGFPKHTLFVNEESNDILPVPAGAPYGSDPSVAPNRQAGLTGYYDTVTGKYGVLPGAGRHNHENTVIVPGWKKGIVALSGDDTFTSTSSATRPNLSQLYMSRALNANQFIKDNSTLWAFRVTANDAGPLTTPAAIKDANDYFDMVVGNTWKGEFIRVPEAVAHGTTADRPQDALEDWSNANGVFQFIRVEDLAYDPDQPRVVYFADTGNTRLIEDPGTGRLYRGPNVTPPNPLAQGSLGRIFKMTFNPKDPTKVDEFSIVTESETIGMRNPDNLDVGHDSLMVQEDITGGAKIWRLPLAGGAWQHVATATQTSAETSGIVDVSEWFGAGWWAVTVQSHTNQIFTTGQPFTWNGLPGPSVGTRYDKRREHGQLLLLHVTGS